MFRVLANFNAPNIVLAFGMRVVLVVKVPES